MSARRKLSKVKIELQLIESKTLQDYFIPNINPKLTRYNQNGCLTIQPLLEFISNNYQNLEHTMVFLFSSSEEVFAYIGNYPLAVDIQVPANEFISDSTIKIRCRYTKDYEEAKKVQAQQGEEEDNDSDNRVRGTKRTKERRIGEIIENVAQWRNFYNGVPNSNGEIVSLTLEDAAAKVGISKKSLDDYLLQLRKGRKYGFNFEEHQKSKVGLLRAFVKKFENIQYELRRLKPGEPIPSGLEQSINDKGTPKCNSNKCCVPHSGVLKIPERSSN